MTVIARRAVVVLIIVAAIVWGRLVLGPWPAAVLMSAGSIYWGLRAWHRFENRPTRPARDVLPEVIARRPEAEARHAAFARALAVVALRYLDQCEQEVQRP